MVSSANQKVSCVQMPLSEEAESFFPRQEVFACPWSLFPLVACSGPSVVAKRRKINDRVVPILVAIRLNDVIACQDPRRTPSLPSVLLLDIWSCQEHVGLWINSTDDSTPNLHIILLSFYKSFYSKSRIRAFRMISRMEVESSVACK